jgi:hypothetical protein
MIVTSARWAAGFCVMASLSLLEQARAGDALACWGRGLKKKQALACPTRRKEFV